MVRYQVIRKDVRFGKRTYRKGEYLPESFSERDKYKVLYPSRIAKVEVPDPIDVSSPSVAEQKMMMAGAQAQNITPQAAVNINAQANANLQPKAQVPIPGMKK